MTKEQETAFERLWKHRTEGIKSSPYWMLIESDRDHYGWDDFKIRNDEQEVIAWALNEWQCDKKKVLGKTNAV